MDGLERGENVLQTSATSGISKMVIPSSLREDMLTRIHVGHMGIEKSKQRARDVLFWPGMCKQIEHMVERCDTCLQRRCSNTKDKSSQDGQKDPYC